MPSNSLISLSSVSNLRLEQSRTQYELAKNFYDDHEFCPVLLVEEVLIDATEHRERVQRRTSPYPSPNSYISSSSSSSASSPYYTPSKQYQYYQQTPSRSNSSSTATVATTSNATRAIPIIDPSNMAPVAVPVQQQYSQKAHSTTPPSIPQWVSYKNTTSPVNTSPSSVHSSLSSNSSSSNSSVHAMDYLQNYYYNTGSSYQQPMMPSTVIRAIPIIDPTTKQAYRQQQQQHHQIHHHHQSQAIPPPGFYNVSVC
ncbi:hypothetical protein MAM1_0034d02566 [Mucor ambiguus]|uniref:Uncharacterized protein n=1 Tax=Mucor ambiguus TaxID=91626 RepID=A0A0C9LSS1_9FUNG|nr:hypothetical protein MAM1_0034d02566 [Mucor ambiguus]